MILEAIKVLYREPDTMSLWGVPYKMRSGQQPADIERRYRVNWVWLGCPGWWGSMSASQRRAVEIYLASLPQDAIPTGPNEWSQLSDWSESEALNV